MRGNARRRRDCRNAVPAKGGACADSKRKRNSLLCKHSPASAWMIRVNYILPVPVSAMVHVCSRSTPLPLDSRPRACVNANKLHIKPYKQPARRVPRSCLLPTLAVLPELHGPATVRPRSCARRTRSYSLAVQTDYLYRLRCLLRSLVPARLWCSLVRDHRAPGHYGAPQARSDTTRPDTDGKLSGLTKLEGVRSDARSVALHAEHAVFRGFGVL
jgi:hypothetical protein